MLHPMKTQTAIGAILAGYITVAAAADGPMQFWLVALAPLAVLGVGFALHVLDQRETGR